MNVVSLLLSGACLATLTMSRPAAACIGLPPCTAFAPMASASLPSSVPGFPFRGSGGPTAEPSVVFRDADGKVVPMSKHDDNGYGFLAPATPLATGTYTATWEDPCTAQHEASATSTITITEPAPLPTRTGSLSVVATERRDVGMPGNSPSNGCLETVDAALVTIAITPDSALTSYQSVVAFETSVDGKPFATLSPFGKREDFSRASAEDIFVGGPLATRIFAICDGEQHNVTGVSPGTHDIEVRARLIGSAPIEPARIRVRVTCVANNGAVVAPSGPLETEAPASPESPEGRSAPAADGCSTSPYPSCSFAGFAALASAVAFMRRRRLRLSAPQQPAGAMLVHVDR